MAVGGGVDRAAGDWSSHQAVSEALTQREDDTKATDQYLVFANTAHGLMERNFSSTKVVINRVVGEVRRKCHGIAGGAPINQLRWRVGLGITEDLGTVAAHINVAIIHKLLQKSGQLRWAQSVITELVRRHVSAAERQAELARPQICTVLREWHQSHFQQIPRGLAEFSQKFEVLADATDLVPSALQRYASQRDIVILRDVQRRELAMGQRIGIVILGGRAQIFRATGLRLSRPGIIRQQATSSERWSD